jgi:hypothetical protein
MAGDLVYFVPPVETTEDHYEGIPAVIKVCIGNYIRIEILSDKYPDHPKGQQLVVDWLELIPRSSA